MGKPMRASGRPQRAAIQTSPNLLTTQSEQRTEGSPIPVQYQLTVSTSKRVCTWDRDGIIDIFRSGSKGIVAARRAANGLLAVADSQIVLLHDTKQATPKSYRLKGPDGQVRLLQYSNDSMNLLFVSTLQHSVQLYSLKHAELLDASSTHPSPPNVFAISHNSHLLLSASPLPTTIHLTSLIQKTPPILLHPQCSSSAVVAAGFHPERANIFFLAFVDSALGLYDASSFFQDGTRGPRKPGPARSGVGAELGYIRKIHALGTYTSTTSCEVHLQIDRGHNPSADTACVGSKFAGITGAAFVPGHQATVMTIGADGKCCIISFESFLGWPADRNGSRNATMLRSWHLHGPATCLSLTSLSGSDVPSFPDHISSSQENPCTIAAIGCHDGHLLLYHLEGTLVAWRSFDPDHEPVICVEWRHVENDLIQSSRSLRQRSPRPKRKSLGSVLTAGRQSKSEVVMVMDTQEEAASVPIPPTPKTIQTYGSTTPKPRRSTSAVYHLDLEPPTQSSSLTAFSEDTVYQTATEDLNDSSGSDGTSKPIGESNETKAAQSNDGPNEQSSSDTIIKISPYPKIPPRPAMSRPGGLLSRRRAESSRSRLASPRDERSTPLMAQTMSVPNMKNSAVSEPSKTYQKRDTADAPEASPSEWVDLDAASPEAAPSPSSNSHARRSVINPRTQESDVSNDIVVDWSHSTAAQTIPTMTLSPASADHHRPTPPTLKRSFARKPRKPAPASMNLNQSAKSDDTVVQWGPSLKKSPRLFDIHKDLVDPLSIGATDAVEQTPPPPVIPVTDNAPRKPHLNPLTETSHNRSQQPILIPSPSKSVPSPPPPGPPPPLPPRSAPREAQPLLPLQSRDSTASLEEMAEALRHTLHKDFKSLRRDLHMEFEKQKAWFENLMRERDGWMRRVEEENGRLREELNRVTGRGKRR